MAQIKSNSIKIFNCLNQLQRVNQFVELIFKNEKYSRLEAYTLIELQTDPDVTIKQLTEMFHVDRSTVSRTLTSLKKRRLVSEFQVQGERSKLFKITAKGTEIIKTMDEFATKIYKSREKLVGYKNVNLVIELYHLLADALEEPPLKARKTDLPYRVAQRRLTKAFKLLNEQAYNSETSQLAFQIIDSINTVETSTVTDLSNQLNVALVSVAASVNSLVKSGYLLKQESIYDKRSTSLILSKKGKDLHNTVQNAVTMDIEVAIKKTSAKKVAQMVDAFAKFVGLDSLKSTELDEVELKTPNERLQARSFYIKTLVQQKKDTQCYEVLFPSTRKCVGYFQNKKLVGVRQWRFKPNSEKSSLEISLFSEEFAASSKRKD